MGTRSHAFRLIPIPLIGLFGILVPFVTHALTLSELQDNPALLRVADSDSLRALAPELKNQQAQGLLNFVKIRDALTQCLDQLENSEYLKQSILSGAATHPCLAFAASAIPLGQDLDDFSKIASATSFEDLQGPLVKRTLTHAARTLFEYRSRFEMARKPVDPTSESAFKRFLKDSCLDCSEEQLSIFSEEYKRQLSSHQGANLSRYSTAELVKAQNEAIEGMNEDLSEVAAAKNKNDETMAQLAYDRYLSKYQRLTSTPAGALFLTDSMKEHAHAVFNPEDFSKKYGISGDLIASRHKALPPYPHCAPGSRCQEQAEVLLKQGLQEIETKVAKHTQSVLQAKSFEELLEADPAIVGSLLISNPELMPQICQAAHRVLASQNAKRAWLKGGETLINAVDVASMGLMLIGGSGALLKSGTALLRLGLRATAKTVLKEAATLEGRKQLLKATASGIKSAAGERYLGTTSGKILAQTMTTGLVSEAGHLLHSASQASLTSGHQDLIVASRLARARTDADMEEIARLEKDWNQSLSGLAKGTALNALPLAGGLMKARTLLKSAKKGLQGLQTELALDRRLRQLVDQVGPEALAKTAEKLKARGMDTDFFAGGMAAISRMDDKVQAALTQLVAKNGQVPDELLDQIVKAGKELSCASL